MTDITDPGTISNGDTPDWDIVQTYFDAIYSVINSPGQLDNNNIKSSAAIAHSKLANGTAGYVLAANGSGVITASKPSALVVPAARAASSASTTVANDTVTAITLGGETYDTDGMHSTVTNTSRMTIQTAGLYRFSGEVTFPDYGTPSNVYALVVAIRINGSSTLQEHRCQIALDGAVTLPVAGAYTFNASDYIELTAYQYTTTSQACTGKLSIDYIGAAS